MTLDEQIQKRNAFLRGGLQVAGERQEAARAAWRLATIQYLHHYGIDHKSIGAIVGIGAARVGQILRENPV